MATPSTSVSDRVTMAIQNDPRTRDAVIDVSYYVGTITLTGIVKSEQVRRAAEEIARNDEGVINVVNEIKVK